MQKTGMLFAMRSAPLTYERQLWKEGHTLIAGVDEVGCGSWAGNVFAAAVILSPGRVPRAQDSKQLSSSKRRELAEEIRAKSLAWAIGSATVEEIDRLNIRQAAFLAMRRALDTLSASPTWVLCDGFHLPGIAIPCLRLVGGDHHSRSIAAASILAKVARDAEMERFDKQYSSYGFGTHKGYGTKRHLEALRTYGVTPLHRRSFAPVQELILKSTA